jgi:hypothetical protein
VVPGLVGRPVGPESTLTATRLPCSAAQVLLTVTDCAPSVKGATAVQQGQPPSSPSTFPSNHCCSRNGPFTVGPLNQ